jgi:hypothetical protein
MAALELLAEDLVLGSALTEPPLLLPRRKARKPIKTRREADRSAAQIAHRIALDPNRWPFEAATLQRIAWLVRMAAQTPAGGWGKLVGLKGETSNLDDAVPRLLKELGESEQSADRRAELVAELAALHALCTGEAVSWSASDS